MTDFGFLSTYPPTQCGLATFTESLMRHVVPPGSAHAGGVVRVLDEPSPGETRAEVVTSLVNGRPSSAAAAAEALNGFDVAVVQHEYGIYGGWDGEDVLPLLDAVRIPTIVVLHTVLSAPAPSQRLVLEQVVHRADATVVMSRTAARRLRRNYLVDPHRIVVIPHGAPVSRDGAHHRPPRRHGAPPTVLTWGLLGPDKGIQWAIDALGTMRASGVPARYLIAGQTHPKILEHHGESYRDGLRRRAHTAGVADAVKFDARYQDTTALMRTVQDADVVLLPYDNTEQVTSGVLIEAVASRRPVVATDFPHAAELLSGGAGLLVPHRDPSAIAEAVTRVLTEPGLAASMTAQSARIAPSLAWTSVAARYRELAAVLIDHPARLVV